MWSYKTTRRWSFHCNDRSKKLRCWGSKQVFKIGRNSKGVNHARINLNSMDTYDVEFISIRGDKMTVKSEVKGVYADMLRDVFEQHTGLRTSL